MKVIFSIAIMIGIGKMKPFGGLVDMCKLNYSMKIGWRSHQIKCGAIGHHGECGYVCGCAYFPTGDGFDSIKCDGSKCCVSKKEV